jgi:hypothetical protein
MTISKRLAALSLTVLIAAAPGTTWADAGHDHGAAATTAPSSALPRFTAVSETFELVGVVNGQQISLYLDRAEDNSPVKAARLELELGGIKVALKPRGEAEFEATLVQALKPGVISVAATVFAGKETDLLAGDLEIHEDARSDAGTRNPSWKVYGGWAIGGLLALAPLLWGLGRFRAGRFHRVGGAA